MTVLLEPKWLNSKLWFRGGEKKQIKETVSGCFLPLCIQLLFNNLLFLEAEASRGLYYKTLQILFLQKREKSRNCFLLKIWKIVRLQTMIIMLQLKIILRNSYFIVIIFYFFSRMKSVKFYRTDPWSYFTFGGKQASIKTFEPQRKV